MATDQPARFFDTRAAYMMFVTTTDEKAVVADRLGDHLSALRPQPPGLRILDAGMGDASVLSRLLRRLHQTFPHIPWLIVAKEISIEDVRQALAKLPDRFLEHPEMVFVVTNMNFTETPSLWPDAADRRVDWRDLALDGSTTHEFTEQISDLYPKLAAAWEVKTSPRTGNPLYVHPSVLVIYRRDREFVLRSLIPRPEPLDRRYDLIVASQTYRARTPLDRKVKMVLVPLARALAAGGRLVVVHSYGRDPGLEIIQGVWPGEDPFVHDRADLLAEARRQLDQPGDLDLDFQAGSDQDSIFRFQLHSMPSEAAEHIGTSSVLAAWNAAAYVAQIDEPRLSSAMATGAYHDATVEVMTRRGRIWFNDETYVISRPTPRPSGQPAAKAASSSG